MSSIRKTAFGVIASLAIASISQAASLGLTTGSPDIESNPVSINYQAGAFTAYGDNLMMNIVTNADTYDTDGVGIFDLQAAIDSSGHLAPGGTLTITGNLYDDTAGGYVSDTPVVLLSGTLTDFGYSIGAGSGEFQFKFKAVSGLLKSHGFPDQGGIILSSSDAAFQATFTTFADALANATGRADTLGLAVPTPAAWSGGAALTGMLALARKRNRGAARD